jgi:hypothetical protein
LQILPESPSPHWLSVVQPQTPSSDRHTGWFGRPSQTEPLSDEHCVHEPARAPLALQAGASGSLAAHCSCVTHASQTCAALQIGLVPEQSVSARHGTHTFGKVAKAGWKQRGVSGVAAQS